MGKFCTLLLVASLAVAGYFLYPCFMKCGHKPDVSQFRLDGYFGATKVVGKFDNYFLCSRHFDNLHLQEESIQPTRLTFDHSS